MTTLGMALGRKKSAGVSVSPRIHKLIAEANALRGTDWHAAALGYATVVAEAPELKHIWIQLGHARKESHDIEGAEKAYIHAASIDETDSEPLLHLGHLTKQAGRGKDSVQYYMRAFELDPARADTVGEIQQMLHRSGPGVSRQMLLDTLREKVTPDAVAAAKGDAAEIAALNAVIARAKRSGAPDAQIAALEAARASLLDAENSAVDLPAFDGSAMVFDASDLISYFKNARLPTGIQRVQIATISNALQNRPVGSVRICCFSDQDDNWTEVPPTAFQNLCELAVTSGNRDDPVWLQALTRLHLLLRVSEPFEFPDGAYLVNLGTSWWLQNYFLFIREAKRKHGIRYVPFVHDFIPIMTPEHCVRELTQDFISWAVGAFQHADFFLANSEATKRDLIKVGATLGHDVDPDLVAVIPLDADFRRDATSEPAQLATQLAKWRLQPGNFVMIVSTIESRKNHIGALDAWVELIRRHGARRVPKLVCVGNRGWLNDAVYARIDTNPALRERVVMLSGLSDDELAMLYRNCRFTLYPSNYEGWGLPVTESLCYGKVPLVSDSSSLPEAGGKFAEYFTAGSTPELTEAAERLIRDDDYLRTREAQIVAEFRPRRWQDIADQIATDLEAFAAKAGGDGETATLAEQAVLGHLVKFGAWYPIERNLQTRIWKGLASAEMFRSGTGWWWPDDWGCWTKPDGGEMTLRLPRTGKALRLYLKIQAPPATEPSSYSIMLNNGDVGETGTLAADHSGWVILDIPASDERSVSLRIEGSVSVDLTERTGGLDPRVIALGVAGFAICEIDDFVARAGIADGVALARLDTIAFNREPSM